MKQVQSINYVPLLQVFAILLIWFIASNALAGTAGGGAGLPWDQGIGSLRSSVKTVIGPALVIIGIVLTFGSVLLGGEIQEFGRRGPALIAGGAGVVGADTILSMFAGGGLLS